MTDKEKIILSSVGGVVSLVLGYLIWRHEQSVSTANQAALDAQNLQAEQEMLQQQLMSAVPAYGANYSPVASESVAPAPTDTNLEAILQAFFGNNQSSQVQPGSTGTGNTSDSTTQTGIVQRVPNIPVGPVGPVGVTGPIPVTSTPTQPPTIGSYPRPVPEPIFGPRFAVTG